MNTAEPNKPEEYLTLPQTARALNLTARSVFNLISRGQLKASRITKKIVRVARADIEAMMKSHSTI